MISIQVLLRLIHPLRLRAFLFYQLRHLGWRPRMEGRSARLTFAPAWVGHTVHSDLMHQSIIGMGFYELPLSLQISRLAREGGLMLDVGANVGYFSLLWASICLENRVLCFEPSPRNLRLLKANIADNQLEDRITVDSCALGKESGKLSFDLGPEAESGWGGFATEASARDISVEVKTLDSITPAGSTIAVLKIDCEGADAWVIEGAQTLLSQCAIKHIFF